MTKLRFLKFFNCPSLTQIIIAILIFKGVEGKSFFKSSIEYIPTKIKACKGKLIKNVKMFIIKLAVAKKLSKMYLTFSFHLLIVFLIITLLLLIFKFQVKLKILKNINWLVKFLLYVTIIKTIIALVCSLAILILFKLEIFAYYLPWFPAEWWTSFLFAEALIYLSVLLFAHSILNNIKQNSVANIKAANPLLIWPICVTFILFMVASIYPSHSELTRIMILAFTIYYQISALMTFMKISDFFVFQEFVGLNCRNYKVTDGFRFIKLM